MTINSIHNNATRQQSNTYTDDRDDDDGVTRSAEMLNNNIVYVPSVCARKSRLDIEPGRVLWENARASQGDSASSYFVNTGEGVQYGQ